MPKISALPIANAASTGDLLVLDQGNITKRIDFNVLQSAFANAGTVQSLINQSLSSGLAGGSPTFSALTVTGPAIFGSGVTSAGNFNGFFSPARPGTTGLGLASIANPALYVAGINALNIIQNGAGGWVGINTIPPTGVLELGDTGLVAFKVVGLAGRTDGVEIAMVQNEAGLRTYGGYFLVVPITSDLTWTKRVNNIDTEALRIANATGNIGIGNDNGSPAPTAFRLNIPRNSGTGSFHEIGIYSQNLTLVAGIGVDTAQNDLQVASIGALNFYANSSLNMGSTPSNEVLTMTSTFIRPLNTGGYHAADNSIGLTSNITIGAKTLIIKDGIITGFS